MERVAEVLKLLADKLGTTAEHLWAVLLQQAVIEAQLSAMWMGIALYGFGGLAFLCLIVVVWSIAKENDDMVGFFVFCFGAVLLVGGSIYYTNYTSWLTATQNPEFYALEQITFMLRSK